MKQRTKEETQAFIAKNTAKLIDDDASIHVMNLGVGIPTLVSNYTTREDLYNLAENGMMGVGPLAEGDQVQFDIINASRQSVLEAPGCSYMSSADAFGLIRGGHVDVTVLGAFEVDEKGDVANWIIPGGKQLGVGGAMDLVSGAKQVYIAMMHCSKTGTKLVKECSLPVTARGRVSRVITELCVMAFRDGRVILEKLAPEVTVDEVREATGFEFECAPEVGTMIE